MDNIERNFGSGTMTSLTTNITKIFPTTSSESNQNEAVINFKNICKTNTIKTLSGKTFNVSDIEWKDLEEDSPIRNDVYTYYEYVQFKRAHFDCESVKYNENTGRIVYMKFVSNGKFN